MKGRVEIKAFSEVTLEGAEGDERYLVEYSVSAMCSHRPGRLSGPPEDCYPDESECEIEWIAVQAVTDSRDNPVSLDAEFETAIIAALSQEEIEEKCWEAFMEGA